jgi:Holliday junction resolvase RusA-like endonuclease
MPKIFVANPYFDEMMIFFGNTIYTSQEKLKPIICEQCDRKNLYEKREKENKTDFINRIHGLLQTTKNHEWPFKEDLLVQFTVSNKQAKLKEVDLDNLAKTLFDALQGIVYSNDSQIIGFAGDKYSVIDIDAFIVAIKRMSPGEKPIYQEFLFSGKRNAWKAEYEQKRILNKSTRFTNYG